MIGIALIIFGLHRVYRGAETEEWEETMGEITRSAMEDDTVLEIEARYSAIIRYSYIVNGREYSSSQIAYGLTKKEGSRSQAKKIIRKYPFGKKVKVYYNREEPSKAVLEVGSSSTDWLIVGFGVLWLLQLLMFTSR